MGRGFIPGFPVSIVHAARFKALRERLRVVAFLRKSAILSEDKVPVSAMANAHGVGKSELSAWVRAAEERRMALSKVGKDVEGFTCDRCPEILSCHYRFDPRNVDGECLKENV